MRFNVNLLALFLLTILTVSCQDYRAEIENTFAKYSNSAKNKDFKDLLNYIPGEYFNVHSKEQIIKEMEIDNKNPDTEAEPSKQRLIKIADRELIEGKYYSLLTYSKQMKFRYNKKTDKQETEDEYREMTNLRRMLFESKYGQENVVFNDTTYFFEINSEEQAYAISDNGQTNWKFISIDDERSTLEMILPKQLVDRL